MDKLSEDLTSALGGADELASIASMLGAQSADENDGDDEDDDRTHGHLPLPQPAVWRPPRPRRSPSRWKLRPPVADKAASPQGRPSGSTSDDYCISLTQKARDGKLDQLVGREREIGAGHPDPEPAAEEQPLPHR